MGRASDQEHCGSTLPESTRTMIRNTLIIAALLCLASAAAAPQGSKRYFGRRWGSSGDNHNHAHHPNRCNAVKGCHRQSHVHAGAASHATFCTAGNSDGGIHLCGTHTCANENACAAQANAAIQQAQQAGISVSTPEHFCGTKAEIERMMDECNTNTDEDDDEATTIIIIVVVALAVVCICGGAIFYFQSQTAAAPRTMEPGAAPVVGSTTVPGTPVDTNTDIIKGETTTPVYPPGSEARECC